MRRILSIENIEERRRFNVDGLEKVYWRTYALLDDGSEAIGYGKDFDLGDLVEVFHDSKWDTIKMRKTPA